MFFGKVTAPGMESGRLIRGSVADASRSWGISVLEAAGAAGRPQRSAEAATFRSLPQQARNGVSVPANHKGVQPAAALAPARRQMPVQGRRSVQRSRRRSAVRIGRVR